MNVSEFKMPTPAEMDELARDARAMRAQFLAAWIGKAFGWVARPIIRHHHA